MKFHHIPVLPDEVIELLEVEKDKLYVDCTLGGGGHSWLITEKGGRVIGIDQDEEALLAARERLADRPVSFVRGNFRFLSELVTEPVDGILIDLGVSSHQLEKPERGFSFSKGDAPLDMRMDSEQELTAADVINTYSEQDLMQILFRYGEEPYARKIARRIVERRPLATCDDLLDAIRSATPPKYRFSRRRHYASKVFRAIRMEVNDEIKVVEEVIPQAINILKPGGRLAIIAFHSLEDRIVKHTFRSHPAVKLITKRAVKPTEKELEENPRSASARLRAVEKLDPAEIMEHNTNI